MKRLLSHLVGISLSAALIAGLSYAILPHVFDLFHTNRVIENTHITRIQGIPFHADTLSIAQPLDTSKLHIAKPSYAANPLCLRLWLGSPQLTSLNGVLSVEVQTSNLAFDAQRVYRQNRSWVFCFNDLRLSHLQESNLPPLFLIHVLQPSQHLALSGIHAGFGPQPLMPATINGQPVEPSIQYTVEVKSTWIFFDYFRYSLILFFAAFLFYFTVIFPNLGSALNTVKKLLHKQTK